MPTRPELKALAHTRLREAKALYAQGLYDGASYLAGYVVELALKARICRLLDQVNYRHQGDAWRSFRTHNLDDLLQLAGLQQRLDRAKINNPGLFTSWSLVTQWNEEFRYRPVGSSPQVQVEQVLTALEHPTDGIFVWLKKYW